MRFPEFRFTIKLIACVLSSAALVLLGCNSSTGDAADTEEKEQTLYNGIELPEQWPPRYPAPESPEAMPVPYLDNPPSLISINTGRQLFVDDFLIEESTLRRSYHTPEFHEDNPILVSDKPWEKTVTGAPYASPFSDGIWYDEQAQKFKMWYLTGGGEFFDEAQSFVTAYAESDDGINWTKPELDIVPGTNVVETSWRDSNTVWLDKLETDPEKRFKLFNVQFFEQDRRWRFVVKYSADGINWSEGVAQSGDIWDRSTVFYNPFREVWVFSTRVGSPSGRARGYLENEDHILGASLVHRVFGNPKDMNNVFWFSAWDDEVRNPDYPEIQPGIYNHNAIAYESLMIGFFDVWQGPDNIVAGELGIQKRNELLIGYSRDGFHWDRPDMSRFMGVNGTTDGHWNDGNMQSINGVPLIVGDWLYFYSSGRKTNDIMWDGWTSTGLARLRRDGFASLNADAEEAYVITRPISFDGEYLFVNTDSSGGQLLAEVLDENGNPLDGFSRADSVAVSVNETKVALHWQDQKALAAAPSSKPVRLKFYLTDASLYSFWVSKYESGESGGYTAGGGPGLHPSGIDLPVD